MKYLIRVIIAIVALLLILQSVSLSKVKQIYFSLTFPSFILYAIALQVIILLINGVTWFLIFQINSKISFRKCFEGNLIVNFAGNFLPGRFAARSTAPFIFSKLSHLNLSKSAIGVFFNTSFYLLLYGIWSLFGLSILIYRQNLKILWVLLIPVCVYLLAGFVALFVPTLIKKFNYKTGFMKTFYDWVLYYLPVPENLDEIISEDLSNTKEGILNPLRLSSLIFCFLLIFSILPALRIYFILTAFGTQFSFLTLLFGITAFYSVTILPISLGGLGIVEGTAIGVFTVMGIESHMAVAVIFADRLLAAYMPSLLGLLLFMTEDFRYDVFQT